MKLPDLITVLSVAITLAAASLTLGLEIKSLNLIKGKDHPIHSRHC
jgi:hypothetical protein